MLSCQLQVPYAKYLGKIIDQRTIGSYRPLRDDGTSLGHIRHGERELDDIDFSMHEHLMMANNYLR